MLLSEIEFRSILVQHLCCICESGRLQRIVHKVKSERDSVSYMV